MRTSRVSQETTRIFNALSSNARTKRTRSSAKGLSSYALGYDGTVEVHELEPASTTPISDGSASPDIEDLDRAVPTLSRKRKFGSDSPTATVRTITQTIHESKWTSPRRQKVKKEQESGDEAGIPASPTSRAKAKPKIPARRTTLADGTVAIHPPANWEELYNTIKSMRQRNPTAPVDTMGCEDLFWETSPPQEKRYHTLTALMLSSQTKDTVTAAAMQRLHTELVTQQSNESGKIQQSGLTVGNILACNPVHLDQLIGKVGFHNNKTKYIKQTAEILKSKYNSDIPSTIEGLVSLPGVGPKMAYLCMSAAWGIDEGIGVDVHVHRISNLWGWHTTKTPEETRAWLEGWLPKDRWHEINKLLVGLGQTVCLPVGRRCGECDLAGTGLCKGEIRGWEAKKRRIKKEVVEVKIDADGQVLTTKEEIEEQDVKVKEEVNPT